MGVKKSFTNDANFRISYNQLGSQITAVFLSFTYIQQVISKSKNILVQLF